MKLNWYQKLTRLETILIGIVAGIVISYIASIFKITFTILILNH